MRLTDIIPEARFLCREEDRLEDAALDTNEVHFRNFDPFPLRRLRPDDKEHCDPNAQGITAPIVLRRYGPVRICIESRRVSESRQQDAG